MDREDWRAVIHGVAKSRTWLSDWTELNWTESLSSPIWVSTMLILTNLSFLLWLNIIHCPHALFLPEFLEVIFTWIVLYNIFSSNLFCILWLFLFPNFNLFPLQFTSSSVQLCLKIKLWIYKMQMYVRTQCTHGLFNSIYNSIKMIIEILCSQSFLRHKL